MNQYAVIVDFSHLFHVSRAAALNAGPAYDLMEVTIERAVGKLRTIKKDLAKERIVGYDLVFAEDRPAERKLALLPGYRAGRRDLRDEKQQVKQYLIDNGSITRFCYSEGNEADDVIATLVRLAMQQQGLFVVIVSGDRDLWQLMGPRVMVFNPVTREFISLDSVSAAFSWKTSKYKCRPVDIPLIKALWGDSTDCIPNVLPRTQKHLLQVAVESSGELSVFTQLIADKYKWYLPTDCLTAYESAKAAIEVNYQLTKLDDQCELIWQ